ncbi:hypothetical protein BWX39_05200 [Prevotella intermedia ATCC 25611 = DSM 20706]|nr:hypothetical protein [Prevotella intermedia]APW32084.1 hypothetical protein BWX39_05200 [Prevotella intermedia ATCC 25611 = DSM 20706]SUB95036.1 Uncharacterised protein [Prevotella intermedia]
MNEGRYDDALKSCNELIVVDFANSRRWSAKIAEINSKKEKAEEEQKRWNELIRDIDSAHLAEDWKKLNSLCKKALDIREDSDIRSKYEKSEEKLVEIHKSEQFKKTMSEINELAVKKEFDAANDKLNSLERSLRKDSLLDAAKEAQIRETRRSLFDFGQSSTSSSPKDDFLGGKDDRTHIKGFAPNGKSNSKTKEQKGTSGNSVNPDFDWDFGSPKKSKTVPPPQQKPQKTSHKTDDSFFDSVSINRTQTKSVTSKPKGKITNDDFDF